MAKLSISSKIPTIPLSFWDDIYKAQKSEWPAIVRKYDLNTEQLNYVAVEREKVFERLRKSEEGMKSWSNSASKYYSQIGVSVN
jgi:hypothetical protein